MYYTHALPAKVKTSSLWQRSENSFMERVKNAI